MIPPTVGFVVPAPVVSGLATVVVPVGLEDAAGAGPAVLAIARGATGAAGVPVMVLAAEGTALGPGTVGPAVVIFGFSAGTGALAVGAGCPGIGEDGLITTPVPPLAGVKGGPTEGVLLAGVVVPVFSCWVEIAPVGTLSFCCPEVGALTVTTLLPGAGGPTVIEVGGVTAGFTVPVARGFLSVVPVDGVPTATAPGLTVSVIFVTVEDLPFMAVNPVFAPPVCEGGMETLATAFSPFWAAVVSVA